MKNEQYVPFKYSKTRSFISNSNFLINIILTFDVHMAFRQLRIPGTLHFTINLTVEPGSNKVRC